jgi:hypothetical protein
MVLVRTAASVPSDANAEADVLYVSDEHEEADHSKSQHDKKAIQRATHRKGHEDTGGATHYASNATTHRYANILSLHPETNTNAHHEANDEAHAAPDAEAENATRLILMLPWNGIERDGM